MLLEQVLKYRHSSCMALVKHQENKNHENDSVSNQIIAQT